MSTIKKILKSFLGLILVGTAVFGATKAFFTDTETSTGNLFQAGRIDLKVDHLYASYNGRECEQGCVEEENLVQNISFEAPVVGTTQLWDIYDSPVGGWNVDWYGGSTSYGGQTRPEPAHLEYHRGVLGTAHEGDQYVELDSDWDGPDGGLNNEPASVTIYQDIPTIAGHNYKLRFAFAPRPDTAASDNHLEVKWGGSVVWDSGEVAGGAGDIVWQYVEIDVTATGSSTELRFTDLGTPNSLGTFIDNITLNEIVCEGVVGDELCNVWEEKDLQEGDFFWNFDDIKPGDWGRNVISLHVYDNDYWACLLSSKDDLENTLTKPEEKAGDLTEDVGELSKYVEVFIWNDLNHDGVYEPGDGEEVVFENGFPDSLPLVEPPSEPWIASNTYYLGLAWCVGEQTVDLGTGEITCDGNGDHNDAQTDRLLVDLRFYVEQSRNNENFSCSNVVFPSPSP